MVPKENDRQLKQTKNKLELRVSSLYKWSETILTKNRLKIDITYVEKSLGDDSTKEVQFWFRKIGKNLSLYQKLD